MSAFTDLHRAAAPLVLPNAWDVASAVTFVRAGFPAVGTTSLGVAAGAGVIDGAGLTAAPTVALAAAIGAAIGDAFVTVDIEDGYRNDPGEVAAFVVALVGRGPNIVGVNIEDSAGGELADPLRAAAKVAAIKAAAPEVFVNARVDTFWLGSDPDVQTTLERARRYADAGADGIFVPGALTAGHVAAFATGVDRPLNVLASPTLTVAQLAELGVARISTGSLPYRVALRAALDAVCAVRDGAALPAALAYEVVQSYCGSPE